MEINTNNIDKGTAALYEGVLTAHEDEYWVVQGQTSAYLQANESQKQTIEGYEGDIVSVVGTLENGLDGDSAVDKYQLWVKTFADFMGEVSDNSSYVSTLGDKEIESHANHLEEYEGDFEDIVREVDDINFE